MTTNTITNNVEASKCPTTTDSTLTLASRTLNPFKEKFFSATYQSFRIIDDFVEEPDLVYSQKDRIKGLKHWIKLCEQCFNPNCNDPVDINNTHWKNKKSVFTNLKKAFESSDIPFSPWTSLYEAMKQDALRKENQTWEDFNFYNKGASQAPSEIFLYLLFSEISRDRAGNERLALSAEKYKLIKEISGSISAFCYLIHIQRDLIKDAGSDQRLVAIPIEEFVRLGKSKKELHQIAIKILRWENIDEKEHEFLKNLVKNLSTRASIYRDLSIGSIQKHSAKLNEDEKEALTRVIRVYYLMHQKILDNPSLATQNLCIVSEDEKVKIVKNGDYEQETIDRFNILLSRASREGQDLVTQLVEAYPEIIETLRSKLPKFVNKSN